MHPAQSKPILCEQSQSAGSTTSRRSGPELEVGGERRKAKPLPWRTTPPSSAMQARIVRRRKYARQEKGQRVERGWHVVRPLRQQSADSPTCGRLFGRKPSRSRKLVQGGRPL